jgi:type I restriction enzyme M protein
VVKLLVKILAPKAGETVYDPACGTGGMLIEAIHYVHNDRLTYGKIFGQERFHRHSGMEHCKQRNLAR